MAIFDDIGKAVSGLANDVVCLFDPQEKERQKREADLKWEKENLHPVMPPHIHSYYWNRVKLIRLDRTNQHRNRVTFQDAVGYDTNPTNQLTVLNLYIDQIPNTGWTFLPNWDDEYYFKHPFRWDTYISLSSYFDYLKKERISELERIALNLGAKHIKIVFKQEEKRELQQEVAIKLLEQGYENEKIQKVFKDFEIAMDTDLESNHHLNEPELLFFKDDTDMMNLIRMRMDPDCSLKKKTYNLNCGGSQCMNVFDAANIDTTCFGGFSDVGASYKSRVETENRTILEYTFEF